MSQTKATKIVSKLRYKVGPRRQFSNPEGPQGRLDRMRKAVTALIKHERIELNYTLADESRGYAERLISDAIRYGECHHETMEMATYWLIEKQLIHKLFKVLVPRYKECPLSYTKMWKAPRSIPERKTEKCVLELRGNIYPPLAKTNNNPNLLHNILLAAAKKDYEIEKSLSEAEKNSQAVLEENQEQTNSESSSGSESSDEESVLKTKGDSSKVEEQTPEDIKKDRQQ